MQYITFHAGAGLAHSKALAYHRALEMERLDGYNLVPVSSIVHKDAEVADTHKQECLFTIRQHGDILHVIESKLVLPLHVLGKNTIYYAGIILDRNSVEYHDYDLALELKGEIFQPALANYQLGDNIWIEEYVLHDVLTKLKRDEYTINTSDCRVYGVFSTAYYYTKTDLDEYIPRVPSLLPFIHKEHTLELATTLLMLEPTSFFRSSSGFCFDVLWSKSTYATYYERTKYFVCPYFSCDMRQNPFRSDKHEIILALTAHIVLHKVTR